MPRTEIEPTAEAQFCSHLIGAPYRPAVLWAQAWAITDAVTAKGSAGWYTRLPTLLELFGDRGYIAGNEALRPERGTSVDGGLVNPVTGLRVMGWTADTTGVVDTQTPLLFDEAQTLLKRLNEAAVSVQEVLGPENRENVAAVHFISHGGDGQVLEQRPERVQPQAWHQHRGHEAHGGHCAQGRDPCASPGRQHIATPSAPRSRCSGQRTFSSRGTSPRHSSAIDVPSTTVAKAAAAWGCSRPFHKRAQGEGGATAWRAAARIW